MKTRILSLFLITGLVALVSSCTMPYGGIANGTPTSFDSNGERIYFTATSSSGQSITYSGGAPIMHNRVACANCHGSEGKGGRVSMMMWSFETPDITWDNLTEADHEERTSNGHEEHPPYTEDSLKTVITRGVDPDGESLDDNMPRWRMSDEDLDDLIEFLKTL